MNEIPLVFQANNQVDGSSMPWFAKQWRVPLNRCIYTAFSYCIFLFYIILYVAEVQAPTVLWIDALTAVWIVSYTFRDMGTGAVNYTDFDGFYDIVSQRMVFQPKYFYIIDLSKHSVNTSHMYPVAVFDECKYDLTH